jgi:hypothetical protein
MFVIRLIRDIYKKSLPRPQWTSEQAYIPLPWQELFRRNRLDVMLY